MVIQLYDDSMADEWDAFAEGCASATFLHTRRFLSYHGERFADRSLVVRDEKQRILALFPAALMPSDHTTVISHPGITYGGILGSEQGRGETMIRVLQAICEYYAASGIERLLYKAVPYIYHQMPAQDDLYALFRLGARRYRCDLSATVDLQHRGRIGSRRKRGYKKALKAGVRVAAGAEYAAPMWDVLANNLKKHDAKPVHTLDEILLLHERFPDAVQFVVALLNEHVEAGLVLFQTPMVSHAQYIASSAKGYGVNALDMLFEYAIAEAKAQGKRYFDFGISTEEEGKVLNTGLYQFKTEFGAGSAVHEFYELDMEGAHAFE